MHTQPTESPIERSGGGGPGIFVNFTHTHAHTCTRREASSANVLFRELLL